MPGVVHAVFGLGLALFIWKLSQRDGENRWSFVFLKM